MKKQTSILSLALATVFTVAPASSLFAAEEIRTVSPELMSALEGWSEKSATFESLAIASHPEAIEAYLPEVQAFHGGVSLLEHFADAYPASHADFLAAVGDGEEAGDSLELLAFVMGRADRDYAAWQAELADVGLAFGDFVQERFPEMQEELTGANSTPADQGIGLLDFIGPDGDEALFTEAQTLLASAKAVGGEPCVCWTVVAFPQAPAGWTLEVNEHFSQSGPFRKLDYTVNGNGAARDINFYRHSRHNLWEVGRDKATNLSSLRVRMQCTKNGSPTGTPCEGPTCKGVLDARIGYASRVYDRIDVGGAWSRQARHLTGDLAMLTYDPPGPAPLQTLFSKGVAVSGESQNSWNSGAIANLLYAGGQVGLVIAAGGTGAANLLSQNLINTTVSGIAGLITHSGQPGSLSADMAVAWDTAGIGGYQLLPNQTHLFELEASSKMYSRGYGGDSKTWGNLDSANYLVSVARNYQCAPGVVPPTNRAHWLYARGSGAPYSAATLQNQVGTFVATELGVYPPNVGSSIGQYP